jgi:pantothenate kinase
MRAQVQHWIDAGAARGQPHLLGITGPPGTGKSTLTAAIVRSFGAERVGVLPMDGFHLANAVLERLDRRARKGAPDTFDAEGFVVAVRRVAALRPGDPPVYVPDFDRALDEPVAGSHALAAGLGLIVVEGNYLGLDTAPWSRIRTLLTELWYLDSSTDERLTRLTARHIAGGRSAAGARVYAAEVDGANAGLVADARTNSDRVLGGEILAEFE